MQQHTPPRIGRDRRYLAGAGPLGRAQQFKSAVIWNGRERFKGQSIPGDLTYQARAASTGHAQGNPPSAAVLAQIVGFETALFTAQAVDQGAGSLSSGGATGGPGALASQRREGTARHRPAAASRCNRARKPRPWAG